MYKYNGLRRRQSYDELVDYLLNRQETIKYPKRTELYPRGILDDFHDQSKVLTEGIAVPDVEDKETQTEIRKIEKATQTDVFHKGVQVNVKINPNEYQKHLRAYNGEEVINYRYWFNWYIKDKATQTSAFTFLNRKEFVHPEFTPPPSPVHEKDHPPLCINMATQLASAFFTPVDFGLAMIGNYVNNPNELSPLHDYPQVASPAASSNNIASVSRTESVASSRPASRPVSVHSSPHYPASPASPSYLPVPGVDSPVVNDTDETDAPSETSK